MRLSFSVDSFRLAVTYEATNLYQAKVIENLFSWLMFLISGLKSQIKLVWLYDKKDDTSSVLWMHFLWFTIHAIGFFLLSMPPNSPPINFREKVGSYALWFLFGAWTLCSVYDHKWQSTLLVHFLLCSYQLAKCLIQTIFLLLYFLVRQ